MSILDRIRRLVANKIECIRLREDQQRRLQQVTLLSRIITLTATADDLPAALESVCAELAGFFDSPQATCALLDADRTAADVIAEYRASGQPRAAASVLPVEGNPAMAYVLEHKRPLAIADAQHDPRLAPMHSLLRRRGTVSLLLVPILIGDEVAGILSIDMVEQREFSNAEIQLLRYVAHQVSQTLERLRLFTTIREHDALMAELVTLSETLNRPFTVAGVVAAIGHGAMHLSQADRAALYLRAPDDTVTCPWFQGLSRQYVEHVCRNATKLPGGQLLNGIQTILISDIDELPAGSFLRSVAKPERYRALAIWPMLYEGRTIAAIGCYYDAPHHWSEAQQEVLEIFARQAAVALENARLYEEAQRQAITDSLTGLYNNRYFYTQLEKELERSDRYGRPCSLIMLDLDDFKTYNDRYGHLAGDDLLQELAHLIRGVIRSADTAARYGGEEFTIILPETPEQDAIEVAERLRRTVDEHTFTVDDDAGDGHTTISGGVATYPTHAQNVRVRDLVNAADLALLQAKRHKNQIRVAPGSNDGQ